MGFIRILCLVGAALWTASAWSQSQSESDSSMVNAITKALQIPTERINVTALYSPDKQRPASPPSEETLTPSQVKAIKISLKAGQLPTCETMSMRDGQCATLGQCGVCLECAGARTQACGATCAQTFCKACGHSEHCKRAAVKAE